MPDRMSPFGVETTETKFAREKKRQQAQERLKSSIEHAKKCINNADFIKYKQEYEDAREKIINMLIDYSETIPQDPIQYAFIVKSQLDKLGSLRHLLKDVESTANRKVNNG